MDRNESNNYKVVKEKERKKIKKTQNIHLFDLLFIVVLLFFSLCYMAVLLSPVCPPLSLCLLT